MEKRSYDPSPNRTGFLLQIFHQRMKRRCGPLLQVFPSFQLNHSTSEAISGQEKKVAEGRRQ
jgi:hypothetical protein